MPPKILLHEPMNPVAPHLLREMFELRHRVFKGRMGWDVGYHSDMERDCYDLMSPVYALYVNEAHHVDGCCRLMPTTGPYLLKDVFGGLLHDNPVPVGPRIWEASRFAVNTAESGEIPGAVSHTTACLMAALLEFGLSFGIKRIVAVSDLRFERLLQRGGLRTHRFGKPHTVGNTRAVAGWFDVTKANLECVRATNGVATAVLSETLDLERAA